MEESQHVGEIDPEAAIQTTGVEPPIHQCVMALDHHETFAFETVHG
jgi:hypothetical protein